MTHFCRVGRKTVTQLINQCWKCCLLFRFCPASPDLIHVLENSKYLVDRYCCYWCRLACRGKFTTSLHAELVVWSCGYLYWTMARDYVNNAKLQKLGAKAAVRDCILLSLCVCVKLKCRSSIVTDGSVVVVLARQSKTLTATYWLITAHDGSVC